ncbi:PRA1 family protein D-like [Medicago truncatula]|uniref:PRA1 family protein n=1 Tax=Medicago truncatula TaxID=3880 RepID=A0A072UTL1_MEDTR|nr:PRA1 family protein D-like [Medicago truncatula]KEH32962.1 PRA1 family protein [Medicago truncatula]
MSSRVLSCDRIEGVASESVNDDIRRGRESGVVEFLLFFFHDRPLVLFRFTIDDRLLLLLLTTLTVVALVFTGVWLNVLVSRVGAAVVVLNEAFQSIDDLYLDEEEIFDGDLLSVVGGSFDTKRCSATVKESHNLGQRLLFQNCVLVRGYEVLCERMRSHDLGQRLFFLRLLLRMRSLLRLWLLM